LKQKATPEKVKSNFQVLF